MAYSRIWDDHHSYDPILRALWLPNLLQAVTSSPPYRRVAAHELWPGFEGRQSHVCTQDNRPRCIRAELNRATNPALAARPSDVKKWQSGRPDNAGRSRAAFEEPTEELKRQRRMIYNTQIVFS
jgi:hypothetical protein